jgi:hypothetical protein
MDGILEGAVPPKSCTSVTVTIDKIVVVLGEGCTAGTVTGLTTKITSKSPGNTMTTTRMTVTISDVMPQEIETTGETEAGNNIGNKGDVGIEPSKVAGEARQMAVQLRNRRRREIGKKRKYHLRKKERDMAETLLCSDCIDPATKRDKNYRTYQEKEKKRKYCARKKERDMSVDSAMCSDCIDPATKRAEYDRTYNSKEHVKKRDADNKRNTHHSTKAAQQAVADVDRVIEATKKKRANKFREYDYSKYLQENGAELLHGGRAEVDGNCCDNCCRKNFSSNLRYALEFKDVLNTKI